MNAKLKESAEDRINREEQHWDAKRLFTLGLIFLGIAIGFIYVMASI